MNKRKRNYRNVGSQHYSFDLEHEKLIYKYLCICKLNKTQRKKLKEEELFNSYLDWKQYVRNKYCKCEPDGLIQFEKYLNIGANNVDPAKEYWIIACGVILAWSMDAVSSELLCVISGICNKTTEIIQIITVLIVLIVLVLIFICGIRYITKPIWDNSEDKNFYRDYIQIIKEIYDERVGSTPPKGVGDDKLGSK